ncbi:MAG: radical SAM protein [Planctomycetes bacterium]|uniref:radical SAM protein n=1 Tax=Candidatus Wunengus sp. YC65 TaxID=3367701 RepID=UPI001DCA8496|nr:radical SAM protein [Planctomycetota bacterium]
MDKYRIDSHKLLYHVPRVNDWLNSKLVYPIYMEVSPSGSCNHRCTFCALDFMGYQKRYLDAAVLIERLSEMGNLGLKSIMYGGEGEPLMHKQIAEIINYTKKCGLDVALTTNAVLLSESLTEEIFGSMDWMKVSIGGATRATYAKIHRAKPDDFDTVINNLSYAVRIKREKGYKCTLGMQILLLPENRHEIIPLAEMARDIGMDYLVVKPYSQHPLSKTERYKDIKYNEYLNLSDLLSKFNTKDFSVIFRMHTMKKWDENMKNYTHCFALPFWSYIDSGGNVWGCSAYLDDERFLYGNIYKNSFRDIWEGEKRRYSLEWVEKELDIKQCRANCRMDEINRYLWDLKHPHEHVNFI